MSGRTPGLTSPMSRSRRRMSMSPPHPPLSAPLKALIARRDTPFNDPKCKRPPGAELHPGCTCRLPPCAVRWSCARHVCQISCAQLCWTDSARDVAFRYVHLGVPMSGSELRLRVATMWRGGDGSARCRSLLPRARINLLRQKLQMWQSWREPQTCLWSSSDDSNAVRAAT